MYASLCIGCVCLVFKFVYMYACVSACVCTCAYMHVYVSVSLYLYTMRADLFGQKNASLENDSVIWDNLNTLPPIAVSTEAMRRGKCVARQLRVAWQGSQKTEPERPCFPKVSFQQKVLVFLAKPL